MSQFHDGVQQQPYQPFQQPPKKKHTLRTVLIVIGALFAVLIVIGALASGTKPAAEKNAPAPSVTTQPSVQPSIAPETTVAEPTAPSVKPSVKPSPKVTKPAMTKSQEQAIGAAEQYLSFKAFSRKGLIAQLSSSYGEGFSKADATYAVDHITVSWNEQAAKAAKEYLSMQHFSRSGLIEQLESAYGDGFTHAQAVYGVNKAGL
jgi:hypothetical protein